jgi:hypothetical protein
MYHERWDREQQDEKEHRELVHHIHKGMRALNKSKLLLREY